MSTNTMYLHYIMYFIQNLCTYLGTCKPKLIFYPKDLDTVLNIQKVFKYLI